MTTLAVREGDSHHSEKALHLSLTPREWQVEALESWREHQRGVVAAVTGSGKTTFALLCAVDFLTRYDDGRVIIVVPTHALLDQWYVTLREDLEVPVDQIALLGSGRRNPSTRRFVVAVINTARSLAAALSKDRRALLIVDECHRAGSAKNSQALIGKYEATLGLSATPERQYDDGFERYVRPVLGDIIYKYTYKDALRDGVIVPFDLVNVKFSMTDTEQREYDTISSRVARLAASGTPDTDPRLRDLLLRRARITWTSRLRVPLSVNLALQHRGERQVIFHESVSHAESIFEMLTGRGVRCTIYHAGLDAIERRENLRLYRKGYYSTLVCCRALDEGLDVPAASIAIIACSTSSTRQRIQRLGRVLRRSSGKAKATIYTLYATSAESDRLVNESADLDGLATTKWLEARLNLGKASAGEESL